MRSQLPSNSEHALYTFVIRCAKIVQNPVALECVDRVPCMHMFSKYTSNVDLSAPRTVLDLLPHGLPIQIKN